MDTTKQTESSQPATQVSQQAVVSEQKKEEAKPAEAATHAQTADVKPSAQTEAPATINTESITQSKPMKEDIKTQSTPPSSFSTIDTPEKKNGMGMMITLLIVVLIIAGGTAYYFMFMGKKTPQVTTNPLPVTQTQESQTVSPTPASASATATGNADDINNIDVGSTDFDSSMQDLQTQLSQL